MSLSYLNFRFIGEVYRVPYNRMILEQSPIDSHKNRDCRYNSGVGV